MKQIQSKNTDTARRRRKLLRFGVIISLLSILLTACSASDDADTSQTSPPTTTTETTSTTQATSNAPSTSAPQTEASAAPESSSPQMPAPPRPADVRSALARIYEKSLTIDDAHAGQALVGDFNGDGSEDIAVVVRPSADMLETLNSEVANWIVEDPHQVEPTTIAVSNHPGVAQQSGALIRRPDFEPRARIESGDTLLAVIHGYQKTAWRNPDAKQTYLLKNGVGDAMSARPRQEAIDELKAKPRRPQIRGDIIRQKLRSETGFLYWTGAKYGWQKLQG